MPPAVNGPVAAPARDASGTLRPTATAGPAALILVGIVLVAVNLRVAVTSLGALLDEVTTGLGLSGLVAGVITMLPTISFAAFGVATPWLARRLAPARILVLAMAVLTAGQAARAVTDSAAVFVVSSALALSGIAIANVLLPALVKQYFPGRVGLITGVYTMTLIFGTATAAAAAVPIADAFGSWRVGLGAWALLALVATLPWLPAALRRATTAGGRPPTTARAPVHPGRTRLGWAMAIYFGAQSLNGYAIMGWLAQLFRDSGFTPTRAGLLLAGVTAISVPFALLTPTVASRLSDLRPLVLGLAAVTGVAYVGLALAPAGPALLWVVLLALGQASFPLVLTMIGLRSRTPAGTVALSAFTQSVGYLIGGLGPLLVGVLYEVTGGWDAPLVFLLVVVVAQTPAGLAVARPRYFEDAAPTPAHAGPG